MLDTLTKFRCFCFGMLSFLPSICSNWWLVICPLILSNNLGVSDPLQIATDTGIIYTAGFVGILIGTVLWPILIRHISKKFSLVLSAVVMSLSVLLMGLKHDFSSFFLSRVLQGASYNIHTVGKDFIFDYFQEDMRQFVLNFDQVFLMIGLLVGPLIGVFLYEVTGESFRMSCIWIFVIGMVISVMTIVLFYFFDWKPFVVAIDSDEKLKLIKNTENHPQSTEVHHQSSFQPDEPAISEKTISRAFLTLLHRPSTRNLIITFGICSACTQTELVISVLFLETEWSQGGLSISAEAFSLIAAISFLPSLYILLQSHHYVPSIFSYRNVIVFFVTCFSAFVIVTPLCRDLLPHEKYQYFVYIVYFVQAVKFFTNSHIYSPFIHFLINKRLNEHIRTGVNSINYFISMVATIVMIAYVVPIFTWTMYSEFWQIYRPFNKYIAFWILGITNLIPVFLIKRTEKKSKEVVIESESSYRSIKSRSLDNHRNLAEKHNTLI